MNVTTVWGVIYKWPWELVAVAQLDLSAAEVQGVIRQVDHLHRNMESVAH